MKYSSIVILFIGILFLQSCGNESLEFDLNEDQIELRDGDVMANKDCFELNYPVKVKFPDGTIISVVDEEDLQSQIKSWYEENEEVKERPSLIYPVIVTFNENKSKVIKDGEQMKRLKKYCQDKTWKERKSCFRLIYPLTYVMPDGSEVSGDTPKDIRTMIKDWYASNPDTDTKPELTYPVSVKLLSGEVITISNEEEMIALKKKCKEKEAEAGECFRLKYPLSYVMPDESVITGENEIEIKTSIKEWYESNPDVKDRPVLDYPVDIIWKDGKSYTINNEDEMLELKKKCKEGK